MVSQDVFFRHHFLPDQCDLLVEQRFLYKNLQLKGDVKQTTAALLQLRRMRGQKSPLRPVATDALNFGKQCFHFSSGISSMPLRTKEKLPAATGITNFTDHPCFTFSRLLQNAAFLHLICILLVTNLYPRITHEIRNRNLALFLHTGLFSHVYT